MPEPATRENMKQRLIEAVQADERIVGLIDYGSSSQGRDDQWSDIDVSLFVRDDAFEQFKQDWRSWAAQFGELLLAYISWVGHPWAVYRAYPVPLRVDFDPYRASEMASILNWPWIPLSAEVAVWYDGSGGHITRYVQQLVGRTLRPDNLAATFEQTCGDFWYYELYIFSKWRRGQDWMARQVFHIQLMQRLFALLRLEAGAIDHWQDSEPSWRVEQSLSVQRLAQLETCVPAGGSAAIQPALLASARLGYDVCEQLARRYGWQWPRELAHETLQVLENQAP